MLDYRPTDYLDFFCISMRHICLNKMFVDSPNTSDIVRDNLKYFIEDYDCF